MRLKSRFRRIKYLLIRDFLLNLIIRNSMSSNSENNSSAGTFVNQVLELTAGRSQNDMRLLFDALIIGLSQPEKNQLIR